MNTKTKNPTVESVIPYHFIQNFLDTMPGNIIVLDQDYKIVFVSKKWSEFSRKIGFSIRTQYKGIDYFSISPDTNEISNKIKNLFSGKLITFEYEYSTKIQKKNHCISLIGKAFNYDKNNWVTLSFEDVTKQKKEESTYLTKQEEFQAIFEQAAVGIARLSLDGEFLRVNDKFCEIIGYSRKKMLQLSFSDITHSSDLNLWFKKIEQLLNGESDSFSTEKRYIHKSGQIIWGKITISIIRKKSGKPKYFVSIFEDISNLIKIETALSESEINYKNLVEQAQDGISLLQNGEIKFMNSAMTGITGYSKEDLLRRHFEFLIADDELSRVMEIHRKRMNNEKVPSVYETAIKKKNGERLEVELNSQLTGIDGKQVVIIRDISKRKKEEKKQKRIFDSLDQERKMFISGPVVVFKWNNDANDPVEYVSHNVQEVFGYSVEEFISGKILYNALIHEDDYERVVKVDREYSTNKRLNNFVHDPYRIVHKEGKLIWVLDNVSIIRDKKGNILNYLGYVVDITRQKEMENELRNSESKYKLLLENIPQKIFLKDTNSVYISCNKNYADDLGIHSEEIKGKSDYDLFPKEYARKFQIDDQRIVENGQQEELVEPYLLFGKKIWNRVIKSPVKDDNGEILGVLGIFWDITEQKEIEEALQESEEKFRTLVTNIEEIIYILDNEGNFLLSEGKGLSKLGIESGQGVGNSAFEIYKNNPQVIQNIKKTLGGETVNFEGPAWDRYFRNWFTPNRNHKGEIVGLLGLSVDITEQKQVENELIKSKERFHDVVMNLQEGFYSTTLDGEILFYNNKYIDMLGLDSNKNYLGLKLAAFWQNSYDRELYIKNLIEKGHIEDFLVYAKRGDGNKIILRTNSRLIKDKERMSMKIEGVFQDVTEQIEAKESLRNSEERLSSFIESATEGFALFDADFNLMKYNKAALKIFIPYLPKSTKIGNNILQIVPFLEKSGRYEKYLDVMKSGKSLFFEDLIPDEKFGNKTINIKAFKVGEGIGMIFHDTTESKEAQLKLKESEEKYRQLIEQSNDGVGLVQNNKIIFTNTVLTEMLGYTKDEFEKQEFGNIVHPDELDRLLDFHYRRMKNEEVLSIYETKLLHRNGRVLEVEFNVSITSYLGETAILIMTRDISKRKKTETKILKYQERLKALASELIITEEKQRKQIATDLHDHVGQLLASSRLQMAAINNRMDKDDILLKIGSISQGMLQAIQSIRNAIFNLSPPQLNEIGLFAATSDWLEDQIELKHGIKSEIKGEDRIYLMDENTRFLIFRSIRELLINVVKHAKAEHIYVTIKEINKNLYVIVEDDGTGFNYHPELYRFKSNSLGLFSINERVTDIGGSMEIISTLGEGTLIKLIIPLIG